MLARAIGRDVKGKLALYAVAIGCAALSPRFAAGIYVLVAVVWLVPDRRIERTLAARRTAS